MWPFAIQPIIRPIADPAPDRVARRVSATEKRHSAEGLHARACFKKDQAQRSAERLFVLCPTTQSPIVTNIRTDVRSLAKAWHSKIQVPCPHCNEIHKYKVRAAFAEAAISEERIRGGFLANWA